MPILILIVGVPNWGSLVTGGTEKPGSVPSRIANAISELL